MCDAIRIAHPQIASDVNFFFGERCENTLALSEITGKCQKTCCENSAMLACDAKESACFLRSSDAKCLRFGLPLQFGLRCERPRSKIASDVGRAMRTTKGNTQHLHRYYTYMSTWPQKGQDKRSREGHDFAKSSSWMSWISLTDTIVSRVITNRENSISSLFLAS